MTTAELHARTEAWREARDAEERLRPARDEAILEALASGMTQRAAAEAVGVSHGLPGHILKEEARMAYYRNLSIVIASST